MRRTKLEINLDLLRKNFSVLCERAKNAQILALVKSDAYGHGQNEIAKALESGSLQKKLFGFGVANVEEGIALRRDGAKKPIYVMSGIQFYNSDLHRCLETCALVPVISSLSVLQQLVETTKKLKANTKIQLKFNTGMTRLGIDFEEVDSCIELLRKNPQIQVEGLMSHMAQAEKPGSALTKKQVRVFAEIVNKFRAQKIIFSLHHLCNSAGLAHGIYPAGNIARVGLNLYGIGDSQLQPIATWRAQIYQIRDLKKGDQVGYGARFTAKKKMKMAVLGVGYADGYRRIFSNKAQVLIKGKRCPVIGSISMDLTAVDISSVPSASTNDLAILLGQEANEKITAEELAQVGKTISWEILTGISPRVPRVFL